MLESRRSSLKMLMLAAAAMTAAPRWSAAAQAPQPLASPNAPQNQNAPAGMNGPDIIKPDRSQPNPLNQEAIAASVQQLYKLASELKDQVEHTDLRATFPLDFIKKAQQIEKLARQIKERAKG